MSITFESGNFSSILRTASESCSLPSSIFTSGISGESQNGHPCLQRSYPKFEKELLKTFQIPKYKLIESFLIPSSHLLTRPPTTSNPLPTTTQLDSESLNKSLDTEIGNQINELLRLLDCKQLERFGSELKLLANLFVWYQTVQRRQSTVGHTVFGLKFADLPAHKRYVQLFCSVIYPFVEQKLEATGSVHFTQLQKTFRLFNFINFLLFLRTGNYLNFWYRLFRIEPQFTGALNLQQATYEFMNRELVWSTAIDFLTFIIPIVDLNKSWTKFKSLFVNERSFRLNALDRPISRDERHYAKCAICADSPIDPHEIGCAHVYCYYCLASQFELGGGLTCFQCKLRVDQRQRVKRINLRCLIEN